MRNDKIYVAAWKYDVNYGFSCIWHYGTKGQRKGERQYQNADGTWTELGEKSAEGLLTRSKNV